MKKLLFFLFALVSGLVTNAQNVEVFTLTSATVSNLFSAPRIIQNVTILATTTNNTTVKFYDSSNASTSIVRAAYTSYSSYATNYDVVFTNSAGLLVTNTFDGIYTSSTSNSAVTNERPRVGVITVPASSQLSLDTQWQTIRGLSALPSANCIVTVTYRTTQ